MQQVYLLIFTTLSLNSLILSISWEYFLFKEVVLSISIIQSSMSICKHSSPLMMYIVSRVMVAFSISNKSIRSISHHQLDKWVHIPILQCQALCLVLSFIRLLEVLRSVSQVAVWVVSLQLQIILLNWEISSSLAMLIQTLAVQFM